MSFQRFLPLLLIGLLVAASTGGVRAQGEGPAAPSATAALAGTGFAYQGELRNGGSLVTATCDFEFSLHDALSAGTQVGATQTVTGVSVANGRFTVTLNGGGQFGARAFDGSARWLAIAVGCPAGSGTTALNPRQPLTPVPLALALPGLRTEPNATSPNVIGGYISNTVGVGVVGATIAGGGSASNGANTVSADYGTMGGGWANTVSGLAAVVGGGFGNNASGSKATVLGGAQNAASGIVAAVGGGAGNNASANYATVGGGESNTASGPGASVGGGVGNNASGGGATVGGGGGWDGTFFAGNEAQGPLSTIGGGMDNTAIGRGATVAGGISNHAVGNYSFAAGLGSSATHDGTFVWTCDACPTTSSSASNQFIANAAGGFWFGGRGTGSTTGPVGPIDSTHFISTSTGAYLSTVGLWEEVSDRNAKTAFAPVNGPDLLDALLGLPVESWTYKVDDAGVRHIGPTAQDFHAAFGLGADDTHLAALDTSGVALAAIQGVYAVVLEREAEIVALRDTNTAQQGEIVAQDARSTALEARLAAVESGTGSGPAPLPAALPWLLLAALGLLNVGGLAGYALARARRR